MFIIIIIIITSSSFSSNSRLNWWSVGLQIQRTKVQIPSGAQEKGIPSQKCCADSLSVCPNPSVYTHAQE